MMKYDLTKLKNALAKRDYLVKEFDINSTPGVEYVTVDPVPLRDKTPAPEKKPEEKSENYFWLGGK